MQAVVYIEYLLGAVEAFATARTGNARVVVLLAQHDDDCLVDDRATTLDAHRARRSRATLVK